VTILSEGLSSRESYHLLSSCVVPRPIAWATTLSLDGVVNAAPFSFFNVVSAAPPMVMIAVDRRKGQPKDTARNILSSKQFVVNIVSESLTQRMNLTSADFPNSVSEIERAGLALAPSTRIQVPGIAPSPIRMECILAQHLEIGTGPTDLIIGEVVVFHVDDEVLKQGRIDTGKLRAIGRLSGSDYCRTTELFSLERPQGK